MRFLPGSAILTLTAFLATACGSTDLSKATKPFREGKFQDAAANIASVEGEGTDGVWIQMEKGSILKAAGRHAESQVALERCQEQMDDLLKKSGEESIAVGGLAGAGAVMTDDRQVTYVGALYEAQLVCALQTMNALLQSNLSQAQAAVSALRARVDEADDVKAKAREYLEKKREENEAKAKEHQGEYGAVLTFSSASDQLTAAYTSWADSALGIGLYLGAIVDRESGRGSDFPGLLLRSAEESKKLTHLADQVFYPNFAKSLESAVGNLAALPSGPTTYVIIEDGLAPFKEVDGALLQEMQQKNGLDVQLPALRHEPSRLVSGWQVTLEGDRSVNADLVCSVSVVKQNEFDVNYPDIRYRAVLGKVIKKAMTAAGAAVAIASEDRNAQMIGAAVALFGAVSDALQGADLRSWDCLPSAYYAVAIPTPVGGKMKITSTGGSTPNEVMVVPGVSNIVVITSLKPDTCSTQSAPLQAVAAQAN